MDHGPPRRLQVTAAGKAVKGTVTFAENDTVLIFDPTSTASLDARVVASVGRTARSADGVSLVNRHVRLPSGRPEREGRGRDGSGGSGGGSSGGGSVGAGSWAAVERYYLRPDELHPDRRLGHLERRLQQPGRAERRGAPARRRHQLEGLAAVRQAARRQQPCAATSSAATPATACVAPATRATAGPRTSAAARATPTARSSASTSSSRARRSYSGGHYVNLMNAVRPRRDRRVGLGRPRPPRHRLLPPLDRDLRVPPDGTPQRRHDARLIRNAVLHINERAAAARATCSRCPTRPTSRCAARTCACWTASARSSSMTSAAVFFFPYLHIRFIEVPPRHAAAAGARRSRCRPGRVPARRGRPSQPTTTASSRSTRTSSGASARSDPRPSGRDAARSSATARA